MRQQSENDPAIQPGVLSSHLWEAANILRGPVDAADFKKQIHYSFGNAESHRIKKAPLDTGT